ncbi:MAG: hypothetical protein V4617_06925 [Gemmatimonadota bacterium]
MRHLSRAVAVAPAVALAVAAMLGVAPCIGDQHALHAQANAGRAGSARWAQDPAADSLVARAIARRGLQLADSTLLSYTASARGFLAFLAQLGEGVIIPPKVVQSEELALAIAWWQPGRSAQRLVGRRDTTLLPAAVAYYRDRYGVILDNLPDRIRLGDGQDVRDVPHPLAASANASYEYQRGDPLTFQLPGREIVVDEVRFRPRDGTQPAAIGSVFLDRETGAVVRLSMTFTRAAILDKRIETLVVTLENGLVQQRYWLPRRQEVEVSRGSTWMDIPARGVVRGRWEVSNYTVNERIPAVTQTLPRWSSAPRDSLRAHKFEGRVVDILPADIQVATSEDVVRARQQAEAAVRAAMLTRPSRASVTGRGVSDFARFNRAEGLALGAGAAHTTGGGLLLSARARYGFADGEVKGRLGIGRVPAFGRIPLLQLFVERDYRDLATPERAGVTNSLASLAFASDYTTQTDTRGAGIEFRRGPLSPFTFRVAYERDSPTRVTATSIARSFRPALPAWRTEGVRAEMRGTGGWLAGDEHWASARWTSMLSAGAMHGTDMTGTAVRPLVARAYGTLSLDRPLGGDRTLSLQTAIGGAAGRALPPQWLVFAGGPWSAPGYDFHQFATRGFVSQRVEFRQPVRAPAIPLGKYGKAPGHVTLAPFVSAVATAGGIASMPGNASGVYPSAGLGVLFFFDLVRADVSRGLRDGAWRFAIDIDRGFWGIL